MRVVMHHEESKRIVGVLLAAGRGARFDPSGTHNKLEQTLANGDMLAVAAAKNLLLELDRKSVV